MREYSIREVAEILQVNQMTVRRKIKAGQLKAKLVQGKNGQQYLIPESELKKAQATETVDVVRMQYPVKLEELEDKLVIQIKPMVNAILKEMTRQSDLLEAQTKEIAELKNQLRGTGRKTRLYKYKK